MSNATTHNAATHNPATQNARTNKISTKFKGLAAAGALAVLLSACGTNQAAAPIDTAPATTVLTSEAPEIAISTPTTQPPVAVTETVKPAPKVQAPKPAAPDFRIGNCTWGENADGLEYEVFGIKADDKDGGLVMRTNPNYNQPAIATILEGEVISSFGTSDTCGHDDKGRTWWFISAYDGSGWVNANYLTPYDFIPDFHGGDDVNEEEEPDVHGDCHILSSGDCVVVYRMGDEIVATDGPLAGDQALETYLACNYFYDGDACTILAINGQSDLLGNSLTQTPDDFLLTDCNTLTGINGELACAEAWNRGLLGE